MSKQKHFIDLCVTSVPYFGSEWTASGADSQLYAKSNYDDYLDYMKSLLLSVKRSLKTDGHLVFMAENIRNKDGRLLPLAWDIGKILSNYFRLYDERIIVYSKPHKKFEIPQLHTNRSHEYALIAKNEYVEVSVEQGVSFLEEVASKGFAFWVYGGFLELIKKRAKRTRDIDILVPDKEGEKKKILRYLLTLGFDIFLDGILINKMLCREELALFSEDRFFRCIGSKQVQQLDIVFINIEDFSMINLDPEEEVLLGYIPESAIELGQNWRVKLA